MKTMNSFLIAGMLLIAGSNVVVAQEIQGIDDAAKRIAIPVVFTGVVTKLVSSTLHENNIASQATCGQVSAVLSVLGSAALMYGKGVTGADLAYGIGGSIGFLALIHKIIVPKTDAEVEHAIKIRQVELDGKMLDVQIVEAMKKGFREEYSRKISNKNS